ncbi:MAG: sorbosone dehydrogenase family protein, partial [Bacteroidota bacterium]|nr:sorbosone dehydrogenase family protein [Bacteroidota bacterium]
MRQIFTLTILFLFLLSCEPDSIGQNESDYVIADETGLENAGATDVGDLRLSLIKMPPGFKIEVWARVTGARSMARAQDGTLFVGTRAAGKVYALSDKDGDGKPDQVITIAQGLNTPNGVAYKNG